MRPMRRMAALVAAALPPARRAWQRLGAAERGALVVCQVLAAGLLVGLVQTCHTAIERGEQLRTGQHAAPAR